ncbi:MAG: GNAT family N-acetyltransferase [Betaproteobacteria bacterium]|nr:GNAT family N-acetyltransferase [Betaproteobacteria bacterium]MBV9362104.1 GNAT family N-acetyltransferase [Betaproteobacteria bacterium]
MNAPDRLLACVLREATAEDLPAVLELYALALGDARTLSREEAEVVFDRMRAYPDFRLYVAELAGRIVGTYSLIVVQGLNHAGARSAVMESVAVHPDLQRRGIGREMVAHARAYCRRRGCYKLALSSNLKREDAHTFYEQLDFEIHGFSFRVMP